MSSRGEGLLRRSAGNRPGYRPDVAFPLSPCLLVEIEVAPDRGAPARAREAVRDALAGRLREEVLLDALIVASEMVSHRVCHGRLPDAQMITFSVWFGRFLVIAVRDSGAPLRAQALIGSDNDESRFLRVLDRLASHWGAGGGGRPTLWAELEPGAWQ